MNKKTVSLRLSVDDDSDPRVSQFFHRLEALIEETSRLGLCVHIDGGNGLEFVVMDEYDTHQYVSERDIDETDLKDVREMIRPVGMHDGSFLYRKDSVAVLNLRRYPRPQPAVTLPALGDELKGIQ